MTDSSLGRQVRSRAARNSGRRGRKAGVETLESRIMLSSYFVSTNGADGNGGSFSAPLRTIQRAASLAEPGDTVFIRGGTYRETVRPARSGAGDAPITFKAYNNEPVTISGLDVVGGWSSFNGNAYQTDGASWDLGDGKNQVFVDGKMMNEARWPNTTLDVTHQRKMAADAITANVNGDDSTAVLRDASLTQPAGYWNGATIHIAPGQGWVVQTGTVTSYAPGRLTYTYKQMSGYEVPTGGDPYYLTGKLQALDGASEWFRADDGTLYLSTPGGDSPSAHTVEVKHRQFAFDLSGKSNITLDGLQIVGATVTTNANSDNLVLNNLDVRYPSHFSLLPTGWARPNDTGIIILGDNSVVQNSTVAYSAGHGVILAGHNDRLTNSVVHDTGYAGGNDAGVQVRGSDNVIDHNTIYNVGRCGIKLSAAPRVKVLYNDIHDVMVQTTDGGAIYTYGADGQGTEIAYNRIHNVGGGGFGGAGVYLDNYSSNFLVHHNVVWNANHGVKLNPPSYNNDIYNNTLLGTDDSVGSSGTRDMAGTTFRNNIFGKRANIGPGATARDNLYPGTDARFVNAASGNFQLRSDSPAIDAGGTIGGITGGHAGDAPDQGAYEFGRPAWVAGAGGADIVTPDPTPDPTPAPVPGPGSGGLDATQSIQAEAFDGQSGIRRAHYSVGYLNDGDWMRYNNVDFGSGVTRFRARIALTDDYAGKTIEVHIGSPGGQLLGTLTTAGTGGWNAYQTQSAAITRISGMHDVYLVFKGGDGVANMDSFSFA